MSRGKQATKHKPRVTLVDSRANDNELWDSENIGDRHVFHRGDSARAALDVNRVFRCFFSIAIILVSHDDKSIFRLPMRLFIYACRAVVSVLLCTMTLTCLGSLKFVFFRDGFDTAKVNCILVTLWLVYGTVCLIFMIYWQASGRLASHTKLLIDASQHKGLRHYRLQFYVFL